MTIRLGWVLRFRSAAIASMRIRCLNVMAELRKLGVQSDFYRESQSGNYDAVIFVKAYGAPEIELAGRLRKRGIKVIFDLCDNHFLLKDDGRAEQERVELLARMIAASDLVVASTAELQAVIEQKVPSHRGRIVVIGDAVEKILPASPLLRRPLEFLWVLRLRWQLACMEREGRRRLVWFGIHGGDNAEYGMNDLKTIAATLNAINRRTPLSLSVISNSHAKYREVSRAFEFPVLYMPWGSSTFLMALRMHELAVIPVTVNEFTRCKSNNRLALSLDQGLPVVASSMPAYVEFSSCAKLDDWEGGVTDYLASPAHAAGDVEAGRTLIRERYSIESIGRQWQRLLEGLLRS